MNRIMRTERVCGTDGTWAQAIKKNNMIFISGQVGVDAQGEVVPGGFEAQARRALDNLIDLLETCGATLENLASITVYVTDMGNRPIFAKVRSAYFMANPPTSTIVEVNALYAPDVLVEVNGVAIL